MLGDVTKETVRNKSCIVWLTNNMCTGKRQQGNYALD